MSTQNPRCYNCIHAGQTFKLGNVTHQHCERPKYTKEKFDKGEISAWDTVKKFSDTCINHSFKKQIPSEPIDLVDGYGG